MRIGFSIIFIWIDFLSVFSAMPSKIVPPKLVIPIFDMIHETNADSWLLRYEVLANAVGWNDQRKYDYLVLYLGSNCVRWFQALDIEDVDDWDLLKAEF